MKKEKININLSAEEQPMVKRLKEMVKLENKIEEAAQQVVTKNAKGISRFAEFIGDTIAGTELANLIKRMFITGAKSEEAKEYHTKGMYTEEDVILLLQKYRMDLSSGQTPVVGDTVPVWFNQNKKR